MSRGSQLFIIFSTVFIDLVGFGMVIPLIGVYGKHFGASGFTLGALAAAFSFMQFFSAPFWGRLSDRLGRRPVLLITLAGQAISYLLFGLADNLTMLFVSRVFAGIFAGNISAAMAYIADITPREERAKGMALVGASFGIGFTLGPPLGGIAAAKLGLGAPGFIAAGLCAANFLLATVRLPESLTAELKGQASQGSWSPIHLASLIDVMSRPILWVFVLTFGAASFSFSNLEQPIPLLIQYELNVDTVEAGYRAGLVLMVLGLASALTQGVFIRRYGHRFDERKLLIAGFILYLVPIILFPEVENYGLLFLLAFIIGTASGLSNPNITGLISKHAAPHEQGMVLGVAHALGSLGRVFGPLCGLMTFEVSHRLPFWTAAGVWGMLIILNVSVWKREQAAVTRPV